MKEDDQEFEEPFDENLDDILGEIPSSEIDREWLESPLGSEIENLQPRNLEQKEVKVMGVYEHQEQGLPQALKDTYFVLLRDNLARQVLIWIGRFEAYAISVALEGASFDRPMTHDLLKNMVEKLGGTVERIVIDDIWQDTYYSKISVALDGNVVDVDARPSDAIALALRVKAPIYMAESILEHENVNEET